MREIKFRAWDGKQMIDSSYGDWISFDGLAYTEAYPKYDTPHTEIQRAINYDLMQFTGLSDKNSNPIYEGDIVRVNDFDMVGWEESGDPGSPHEIYEDVISPVSFGSGSFCFESGQCGLVPLEYAVDGTVEVIGNVYQNPELLNP